MAAGFLLSCQDVGGQPGFTGTAQWLRPPQLLSSPPAAMRVCVGGSVHACVPVCVMSDSVGDSIMPTGSPRWWD